MRRRFMRARQDADRHWRATAREKARVSSSIVSTARIRVAVIGRRAAPASGRNSISPEREHFSLGQIGAIRAEGRAIEDGDHVLHHAGVQPGQRASVGAHAARA